MLFLYNRVFKSTKEYKVKLRQLLQYLKHTINDERIMVADRISQLFICIDTTYGVKPNLKIHTGGFMSFLYRMVNCKSRKKKLNTKSSTNAKVVSVSDYLPYNIFICLFMGAQGYDTKQTILFQVNHSAINMEKKRKNSCTGNSRHINIRYLFS